MASETVISGSGEGYQTGHTICWRSTLAGLAVALITYIGALCLAMAFGGIGLSDGSTVQNAAKFTGASVALATILATFAGGYLTVRLTRARTDLLGSIQGLVVGAVFMAFVIFQVLSVVGTVGQATASAIGAAGSAGASLGNNPVVMRVMEDQLGDLKLKSDPATVVQGTASRLLDGDQESAKNYLAAQAGMTPAEADQRIAAAKTKIDEAKVQAQKAAADVLKTVGWSLFLTIAFALMASTVGGLFGTVRNNRWTIEVPDSQKARFAKTHPAY